MKYMALLCILSFSAIAGSAEYRNFTNQEGKTIAARVADYDTENERVQLELKNRKKAWIELTALSKRDQTYIQELYDNRSASKNTETIPNLSAEDHKISSAYVPKPTQDRLNVYDMLVGSWYGTTELEDGGIYEWITRLHADGEYRLEGRITYPDYTVNEVDYGDWGFNENMRFTIHRGWIENGEKVPKNPSYPKDWVIYEILDVSHDTHQYRTIDTGNTFSTRKVSDDFQLD